MSKISKQLVVNGIDIILYDIKSKMCIYTTVYQQICTFQDILQIYMCEHHDVHEVLFHRIQIRPRHFQALLSLLETLIQYVLWPQDQEAILGPCERTRSLLRHKSKLMEANCLGNSASLGQGARQVFRRMAWPELKLL